MRAEVSLAPANPNPHIFHPCTLAFLPTSCSPCLHFGAADMPADVPGPWGGLLSSCVVGLRP